MGRGWDGVVGGGVVVIGFVGFRTVGGIGGVVFLTNNVRRGRWGQWNLTVVLSDSLVHSACASGGADVRECRHRGTNVGGR